MPGKIVSFPKFRNFQITDKRLTLRNNKGHFRTQRTIKHQETPTNQNKKTRLKICCQVIQVLLRLQFCPTSHRPHSYVAQLRRTTKKNVKLGRVTLTLIASFFT